VRDLNYRGFNLANKERRFWLPGLLVELDERSGISATRSEAPAVSGTGVLAEVATLIEALGVEVVTGL